MPSFDSCAAADHGRHHHQNLNARSLPRKGCGRFSRSGVARVRYASRVSGTRDAADGSAPFDSGHPVPLNNRTATGHYDAARGATSRPSLSAPQSLSPFFSSGRAALTGRAAFSLAPGVPDATGLPGGRAGRFFDTWEVAHMEIVQVTASVRRLVLAVVSGDKGAERAAAASLEHDLKSLVDAARADVAASVVAASESGR